MSSSAEPPRAHHRVRFDAHAAPSPGDDKAASFQRGYAAKPAAAPAPDAEAPEATGLLEPADVGVAEEKA